jgi:hypothetical protein
MLQSYTAVVERAEPLTGDFATEPYEAGWAREAIVFVRVLSEPETSVSIRARVQISPDGIHWADEGTEFSCSQERRLGFAKVIHFGNWLRVAGTVQPAGASVDALVYIHLKA